jgi:hypothetical protein
MERITVGPAEKICGWKLIVQCFDNDEYIHPVKYYIQKDNAIKAGIKLLVQMLEDNKWKNYQIQKATREYWKLVNNAAPREITMTTRDSFFDDNGISIELIPITPIVYEDE